MITYGGRFHVTLETYHGVPNGWSKPEVLAAHRTLRGSFSIETPEATEPGAPAWLPDRRNWLQYRATLYLIAEGARANDAACIELAVRYIELRYIGSYSGFIRARLARGLKNSALTDQQKERLNRVFLCMVEHRDYTEEFNEYVKLWQRIVSAKALKTLEVFAIKNQSHSRLDWLRRFVPDFDVERDEWGPALPFASPGKKAKRKA